jgi:hypothetical protein
VQHGDLVLDVFQLGDGLLENGLMGCLIDLTEARVQGVDLLLDFYLGVTSDQDLAF